MWAVQVAALVALWAAFLVLQLAKARRRRCSWGFAAAAAAQAVLLAAAAAAYVVFQVCVWPWQGTASMRQARPDAPGP